MAKNTGKEYEDFVAELQQAILSSETLGSQKNIEVIPNKLLKDKNGIERQFDIYWEFELAGIVYKNIIECKDYASKISIDRVDSLIGKLNDFNNITGVFATKTGYQSGAESKALANGIDILRVREQNDSDWISPEGTPLIKEAIINITIEHPARITSVNYLTNDAENTGNLGTYLMNEIFIKNLETSETYSLHELEQTLNKNHFNEKGEFEAGQFEKKETFNGEVIHPKGKNTITGYHIKYTTIKPSKETMNLEFYKTLKGVIEYLHTGKKVKVFDDGRIHKE